MKRITQQQTLAFQNKILTWYVRNKRDLPWREVPFDTSLRQRDPYKILVAEVMLQQTQVSRVIPKYEAWLKAFPTIDTLAKASARDVLSVWSGLGYNRRALYLREAAKIIVEKFDGAFPREINTLKTFPGVGEYTACAITCFAFDKQVALVDTNVRKVILLRFGKDQRHSGESRSAGRLQNPDSGQARMTEKEIQTIADQLLPKGVLRLRSGRLLKANAYDWNQALMDYSAVVLKDKKILPRSGILLRKTKQSKFIGSRRYYRGIVIKLLLEKKTIEFNDLVQLIRQRSVSVQNAIDLKQIVEQLHRERMIVLEDNRIKL